VRDDVSGNKGHADMEG